MRSSNRRRHTEDGGWRSNRSGYSIAKLRGLEIGGDNGCCNCLYDCSDERLEKADVGDAWIGRIGGCLEIEKILDVCARAGVRKSYCRAEQ